MKDHIQKLADKAKKSVPHGLTPDKWIEVYNEKFAELIIRECMSVAQEYDGAKLGGPGLIIAMRIEQHFGVEE